MFQGTEVNGFAEN